MIITFISNGFTQVHLIDFGYTEKWYACTAMPWDCNFLIVVPLRWPSGTLQTWIRHFDLPDISGKPDARELIIKKDTDQILRHINILLQSPDCKPNARDLIIPHNTAQILRYVQNAIMSSWISGWRKPNPRDSIIQYLNTTLDKLKQPFTEVLKSGYWVGYDPDNVQEEYYLIQLLDFNCRYQV